LLLKQSLLFNQVVIVEYELILLSALLRKQELSTFTALSLTLFMFVLVHPVLAQEK
jgi:hypothetical protein